MSLEDTEDVILKNYIDKFVDNQDKDFFIKIGNSILKEFENV